MLEGQDRMLRMLRQQITFRRQIRCHICRKGMRDDAVDIFYLWRKRLCRECLLYCHANGKLDERDYEQLKTQGITL